MEAIPISSIKTNEILLKCSCGIFLNIFCPMKVPTKPISNKKGRYL